MLLDQAKEQVSIKVFIDFLKLFIFFALSVKCGGLYNSAFIIVKYFYPNIRERNRGSLRLFGF